MNLSDEQKEKVRQLSGLFLAPEEIAILTGIDIDDFVSAIVHKIGDAYHYYLLGKTESKQAIRENVIKMAKHGSPAAEELAEKYIQEQELEERRNDR